MTDQRGPFSCSSRMIETNTYSNMHPNTITDDVEFPVAVHAALEQRAAKLNKTFDQLVNDILARQLEVDG